ncbi:MAG: branched-chain amino acid ABC transporter permease [Pseudomonadota bacterium]
MAGFSQAEMADRPGKTGRRIFSVLVLILLGVLPPFFMWIDEPFYMDLATRLVCLAIAAVSLNLILGYGGMVSFGHAVYIGIGAYCVGIPSYHATYGEWDLVATYNGFIHLGLAVFFSAFFAFIVGAICLRTRGVYFIMITMAFSQMMFFFLVSLEAYGGDDGLTIDVRSEFPLISLDDPIQLYLVCYISLILTVLLVRTIIHSRFGMVLRGGMDNEERMRMIGYNVYLFRLTAFVIAGAICGYAGALLGNFTTFISPEMIDWTRSGEMMFMVILGGAGSTIGPVMGAVIFIVMEIVIEEVLAIFSHDWGKFWHLPFGMLLILSVLFLPGGLVSLFNRKGREK